MSDAIKPVAWVDAYGEPNRTKDNQFKWPLYDQSTLDAAVAAERERWARMTNAELQGEIGRLQQILVRRICGDPVQGIGLRVRPKCGRNRGADCKREPDSYCAECHSAAYP